MWARSLSRCWCSSICWRCLRREVSTAGSAEAYAFTGAKFSALSGTNPQPRLAVTTRPSQREAEWAFGPFQSNAAAERFSDELLKLFLLRRCTEDLECSPTHPGCVYGEMKMCLAPCQMACTPERYAEEAAAVERFLETRGESSLAQLARGEREGCDRPGV